MIKKYNHLTHGMLEIQYFTKYIIHNLRRLEWIQ